MQWGKRWAFFMGHRRASVPLSLLPLYFFDPHVYERFIFQIFPSICRYFIRIPDWCKTFRRTLSKRSSLFCTSETNVMCFISCYWFPPSWEVSVPGFSFEGIRRTPIFYRKVQKKKSPRTPYRFLTNLTLN